MTKNAGSADGDGRRYWLMKSEPDCYSWDDLVAEGEGTWDGVRNHRAANNLRAMKKGDKAFFYHSNIGLEIVGIVTVSKPGIADPSDPEGKWAAVKVKPAKKLKRPVTFKEIKADPALADMELVRLSRLSIAEVRPEEWEHILGNGEELTGTPIELSPKYGLPALLQARLRTCLS